MTSMEWSKLESRPLTSLSTSSLSSFLFPTTGLGSTTPTAARWNRNPPEHHSGAPQTSSGASGLTNAQTLLSGSIFSGPVLNLSTTLAQTRDNKNDFADPTSDTTAQRLSSHSNDPLQVRFARHEQNMFNRIIKQQSQDRQRALEDLFQRRIQNIWQKEREIWVQQAIGTPLPGGAGGHQNNTSTSSPLQSRALTLSSLQKPRSLVPGALVPTSTAKNRDSTKNLVQLDPAHIQAHLDVVRRINSKTDIHSIVDAFYKLAMSFSDNGNNRAFAGYAVAWRWVYPLVTLTSTTAVSSALSLPNKNQEALVISHARASLLHLSRQFRQIILDSVKNHAYMGTATSEDSFGKQQASDRKYRSELADACFQYVQTVVMVIGDKDETFFYPMLFYCLRCGDAVAALEILNKESNQLSSDSPIYIIIQSLVDAQQSAGCLWEENVPLPRLGSKERQAARDLVEILNADKTQQDQHQQGSSESNIFKRSVYSLLSGSAILPNVDGVPGLSTIEDYLMGSLWKALLSDQPSVEVNQLAELIRGFGPDYFGNADSGGWAYALPTLVTQQYETALTFLGESGGALGLMQAAHLGIVLSNAGIPIRDIGRADNSLSFTADLIAAYADYLLTDPSAGSIVALEYLIRIPNKARSRKEVASLIAKTGAIDKLVGTIDAEGIRQDPTDAPSLSQFFTRDEINMLLTDASRQLLRKQTLQTNGMAAMCYMLAGRYADVLSLLNQFISPPHQPNNDRSFWLDQTKQFHALYLDKRTHVLEVLEREDKLSLITTNLILVDMNTFFFFMRDGRTDEAWALVESPRLNSLLPSSSADITVKQRQFQLSLDSLVKEAMPSYIVGTMEALSREYRRLKQQQQAALLAVARSNIRSASSSAAAVYNDELQNLRSRARLLVTFAGVLGVANDQTESLSRLESMMV